MTTVDSRQFEIGDDPMKVFNIASIPGDGVGKEVVPAAQRVLKAVSDVHGGLSFRFTEFPYSCEYYLEHGEMMPDDGLEQLKEFDSIFLGAVGNSKLVPDHISLWGLLIKSAANLNRSSTLDLRNICKESSLRWPTQRFDLLVVRETVKGNTARSEAESSGMKMKSPFKMPFFKKRGGEGDALCF
ncbi:isocitrate/isopropylmalate family dehydrogenase [Bacillus licheniformis]|nr:isocitrate/isopropylmalate family dehydrogenase [Bacillus licheniformis]